MFDNLADLSGKPPVRFHERAHGVRIHRIVGPEHVIEVFDALSVNRGATGKDSRVIFSLTKFDPDMKPLVTCRAAIPTQSVLLFTSDGVGVSSNIVGEADIDDRDFGSLFNIYPQFTGSGPSAKITSFVLRITNGPAVAVSPCRRQFSFGAGAVQIEVALGITETRALCNEVYSYIRDWEVAHFAERVAANQATIPPVYPALPGAPANAPGVEGQSQ